MFLSSEKGLVAGTVLATFTTLGHTKRLNIFDSVGRLEGESFTPLASHGYRYSVSKSIPDTRPAYVSLLPPVHGGVHVCTYLDYLKLLSLLFARFVYGALCQGFPFKPLFCLPLSNHANGTPS